ncbi:MAG: hypothetical protein RLZZ628_2155 [Bacteroidota bacterium]
MELNRNFRGQRCSVLLLMIGLIASRLDAQPINRYLNDVAMPSANATAFGKYGDIPVSHFTGVPNISIPITTIQEGPLSLPIRLSYHASGIKVAELASWVGLGWNLNFGGQISRTILGFPDESAEVTSKGYLNGGSAIAKDISAGNIKNYLSGLSSPTSGIKALPGLQINDLEPDIFSFTAGNYSGKFYINANKEVVLIPKQDIKVEFDLITGQDGLRSFTITTPEGHRYLYGMDIQAPAVTAYEKVYQEQNIQNPASEPEPIQIWHLLKIEDYSYNFHRKI